MILAENEKLKTMQTTFHKGAFELLQPAERGYRSGLDAMLIAAALPPNTKGVIADLGAGTGAAGIAALNLNPNIDLIMVEKNKGLAELAQQSIDLPNNRFLKQRCKVVNLDVTVSGNERTNAGLGSDCVDHTIMNPPYNYSNGRAPSDTLRSEAFMMGDGGIDAWFRTAAAITKPGGTLVTIYRSENLGDILACTKGRFGGLEILPVHSRADEPARRIIARATCASRAPMALLPGFIVHEKDGSYTQEAQSIVDGKSHLNFL